MFFNDRSVRAEFPGHVNGPIRQSRKCGTWFLYVNGLLRSCRDINPKTFPSFDKVRVGGKSAKKWVREEGILGA